MKDEELADMAAKNAAAGQMLKEGERTPGGFTIKNFLTFVVVAVTIMIVGQFTPGIPDEDIINFVITLAYIFFFGVKPQLTHK